MSPAALAAVTAFRPDFILLDLGVSSRQLDEARPRIHFPTGRAARHADGRGERTAADFLNDADETGAGADLRGLRRRAPGPPAGPRGRPPGAAPVRSRPAMIWSTRSAAVLGPRAGPPDFARLFQAVRIAVNDELDGLARALPAFRDALVPGGRLAVISYHSGEDRLVKHAFRDWASDCVCPPRQPVCTCRGPRAGPARAAKADRARVRRGSRDNPRARSAKLRIFRVADAP